MPPTQLSAVHPSPKRKRDNPPNVPLLNTTLRSASTPPRGSPTPSGAESPRNVVADQLRGMTIAAFSAIPMSPLTPTDDVVRKKPKLDETSDDNRTATDSFSNDESTSWEKGQVHNISHHKVPETERSTEIPETPQPQPQQPRPRIFADIMAFSQPTAFVSSPTRPPAQEASSSKQPSKPKSRPAEPHSRKKSPSPPLSTLTWQDSEITGHLVDPSTDPDDDGTGINGIGFRPTPALAYARAQRRKQQLMDWRAREAREARAKRSERRRRGIGGAGSRSREGTLERDTTAKEAKEVDAARRAVRFAI